MVSGLIHIIYKFATHSAPVDQQDGHYLEHARNAESRAPPQAYWVRSQFQQDSQVLSMHIHIWKELLYRIIYNCVPQIQESPNWIGKIRWRLKKIRLEYDYNQ